MSMICFSTKEQRAKDCHKKAKLNEHAAQPVAESPLNRRLRAGKAPQPREAQGYDHATIAPSDHQWHQAAARAQRAGEPRDDYK